MKKFSLILIALIVFVGCDQGQKMVALVMTGDPPKSEAKDPPPPVENFPNEKTIPTRVTFGNVLDLQVGERYKMRPTSYIQRLSGVRDAHLISELFFSNVRDRLTAAPPAIEARFILTPALYMQTSERELVIKSVASGTDSRVYDEILIDITQKKEHGEKRGFRYVIYEAVAIENLTNPDLKFKSEPPPVEDFPPDFPNEEIRPELTFGNVLDLQVGEMYRLIPVEIWETGDGIDAVVTNIIWGSITIVDPVRLRKGISADIPKIVAEFNLTPRIYSQTIDGEDVIACWGSNENFVRCDEIVIEIIKKKGHIEEISSGGRLGDPFTYQIFTYEAVAIENLTNPDKKFEYE